MSAGVSQIEYWREANKPDKNTSNNVKNVKEGGPGGIYLSYDVFLGLSVLGGLFALDHLYLRSPLTFLAKLIINFLTLGTWWLYDASQAVFNKDVVKVFGLGVPGMGPKGIAAGVLASDVPDKKHMSFLIYAIALMFGGLFGLDSFIVGDKSSGIIRIICLITVIFAPIALLWWLFNVGKFFLKTKDVTNTYWEYFGAPPPAGHGKTFTENLVSRFPILDYIIGPLTKIKNAIFGVVDDAEELGEAAFLHPIDTLENVVTAPIRFTRSKLGEIASTAEKIISGPVRAVGEELNTLTNEAGSILTRPLEIVGDKANKIVTNTVRKVETQLKPAINAALVPVSLALQTAVEPVVAAAQPFKETLNTGLDVVQTGLSTVQDSISLGRNALNTGSAIAGKTLNVVGETAQAATAALALAPQAAALTSGFTESAAQTALTKLSQQGGGSNSGILPYMLISTLAVIVVSGLVLTYRRSRQNVSSRNDSPPEPGVLREFNQEKSSQATRPTNYHKIRS